MASFTDKPKLDRFALPSAINFAHRKHYYQIRKDANKTPYIAHLLTVASNVMIAGGRESAIITAVLHDILEDTDCTADELGEEFGDEILGIVLELSEDKSLEKSERKMKYAESIIRMSHDAALVTLGDKLDNIRNMESAPNLINEVNRKFYLEIINNLKIRLTGEAPRLLLADLERNYQRLFYEPMIIGFDF